MNCDTGSAEHAVHLWRQSQSQVRYWEREEHVVQCVVLELMTAAIWGVGRACYAICCVGANDSCNMGARSMVCSLWRHSQSQVGGYCMRLRHRAVAGIEGCGHARQTTGKPCSHKSAHATRNRVHAASAPDWAAAQFNPCPANKLTKNNFGLD